MSVASPLWDRTEFVIRHLNEGYWEADLQCKFVLDLCKIIENTHRDIKKLAGKYKKTAAQRLYAPGHGSTFSLVQTLMEQSENCVNHLQTFEQSLKDHVKELRASCDGLHKELEDGRKSLQTAEDNLQKGNQKMQELLLSYQNHYREMLRAQENSRKADENLNLSRKEVYRFKSTADQRTKECDVARLEYITQVDAYNNQQHTHYFDWLTAWTDLCRVLEQRRYSAFQTFTINQETALESLSHSLQDVASSLQCCRNKCDDATDWSHFINNVVTGNSPPSDVEAVVLTEQSSGPVMSATTSRKASVDSVSSLVSRESQSAADSSELSQAKSSTSGLISKLFRKTPNLNRTTSSLSSMSSDNISTLSYNSSKRFTESQLPNIIPREDENVYDHYNYTEQASNDNSSDDDKCGLEIHVNSPVVSGKVYSPGLLEDKLRCTALYRLDGDASHQILQMEVGEQFIVIQKFINTDWHSVMSLDGSKTGIVPANYVSLPDNA